MRDTESYERTQRGSIGPVYADIGVLAAGTMLVVWAVGTFAFAPAPGWLHALLTIGVFLLIYRIVVRGASRPSGGAGRR